MAYNRAAAVTKARRSVHNTMRVSADYEHPALPGVVTPLSVRWHNRQVLQGNIVETGYSDVIDGVNRVIFDLEELNEKGVVLERGGVVTLTDPVNNGIALILEAQEPDSGPINRIWLVAKQ